MESLLYHRRGKCQVSVCLISLIYFCYILLQNRLFYLSNYPFWIWNSLSHGLSIFQEGKSGGKDSLKLETNADSNKVFFFPFSSSVLLFSPLDVFQEVDQMEILLHTDFLMVYHFY